MNRIFKTAILSAAVAATTLATLPAANAGDDWRHRRHTVIPWQWRRPRRPASSALRPAR